MAITVSTTFCGHMSRHPRVAGHTHGGQSALESVHRGLNLGQLLYRYGSGWYEEEDTRLRVSRGIGTTGFSMRFGIRPEITVAELIGA